MSPKLSKLHFQTITMNKVFLFALLLPALVFGQANSNSKKSTAKSAAHPATVSARPADGFVITGSIKGFPDGTSVSLLNGQTGAPESETTVSKNSFTFSGKVGTPEFKVIMFNKKPPYITLFLDNSAVKITGVKDSLDYVHIDGSASNADYYRLSSQLAPYQKLFQENAPADPQATDAALKVSEDFVKKESSSFAAPLAIIRYSQLTDETNKVEELFNLLSPEVKELTNGRLCGTTDSRIKKERDWYSYGGFYTT